MSFSILIRQHLKAEPAKIDRWEKAFLELQVLLASCDGIVGPAERMTLSLLSLARRNEKENLAIVDGLLGTIQRRGFDEAADRVLDDIGKLAASMPQAQRLALAQDILRESITIVLADDVVSDKERAFVVNRLAPGLSLPPEMASTLLDQAAARVQRSRQYVAFGFELFLCIIDASAREPVLHAPPGRELPEFLAAVDRIVVEHKLGSSRAVVYFVGAMAGMFWVEDASTHCAAIARLAEDCRRRAARSGLEARLGEIHAELVQMAGAHPAPDPFLTVSKHMTAALNKMDGLDAAQRAMFRDHVAPALRIDHEELLRSAAQRRSLADLHRNLTASDPNTPGPSQRDDPQTWWRFWR